MSESELEFVPVKEPEHIAELANFADGIFREYFSAFHPEEKVDYLCRYLLGTETLIRAIADEGYEYYFMNADGVHVGFVGIQPREGYLFLSKLYLLKEQRGHGFGRQGFEFVKQRAQDLGYDRIRLTCARDNTCSLAVYDHMGLAVVESVDTEVGEGIQMNDYILEYQL